MAEITAKYKFQIEKIVGKPGIAEENGGENGRGCAVFSKNITLPDGSDGMAVGCVLVRGDGDIEVITQDVFNFEVSILENLGAEGILEPLKGITTKVKAYVGERKLEISFVLGFFYKDICYLIRENEGVVVQVFEGGQGVPIEILAGSGKLSNSQIYMIATGSCVDLFDFGVLNEADAELSDVIDGMATEISAREESADIGAIFIKVIENDQSTPESVGAVIDTSETVGLTVEDVVTEGKPEVVETVVYEQLEETAAPDTETDAGVIGDETGASNEMSKSKFGGIGAITGVSRRIGNAGVRALHEIGGVFRGDRRAIGAVRKKLAFIIVVVILVLVVSVGMAIKQRNDRATTAEFNTYYETANSKYSEGAALLELNKFRAREILVEAQGQVQKALELKKEDSEALKLAENIEDKLKEADVTDATSFENIAEVGESIKSISTTGKNLIAVGSGKTYEVTIGGQVTEVLSDMESAVGGTVFDNKLYWVGKSGAWRQDLTGGNKVEVAGKTNAFDLGVFFGNVYLLTRNQVAKIVPIEDGYAAPSDYLQGSASFADSSRMAIDTNIWVTVGDKILKFNRGKAEPFEILGIAGKIGELGPIYTDGTLGNLYVIDKVNSALLIIDKDGNYKKTLQAKELANATDLVVNEAEDTVYVAVGKKIVSVALE